MDILETAQARIRGQGRRVVFPEGGDERIATAAARLAADGLCVPIVLDDAPLPHVDRYAALYREGRPDASEAIARRLAAKPLFHAGLMVKAGDADAMIAGVANPTARVIEAGMLTIGLAPGIAAPSSFFAATAGTSAASACNSPSIASAGSRWRAMASARNTLSMRGWRALPFVENDSMATRGSSFNNRRALFADAIAMSASAWADGSALTAQSA